MRLAIDAMGGDFAPQAVVEGAAQAARRFADLKVTLVGNKEQIEAELDKLEGDLPQLQVRHASQVVSMHERPIEAIKNKPDSSIRQGIGMVRADEADGFLSAGNTGAVVVASILLLKKLTGVHRPGIAANFPTAKGACTIIDVGANLSCTPGHLYQYALMGTVFRCDVLGSVEPTVGLLNVGAESLKGSDMLRETHGLLSRAPINFLGNIEGQDIAAGKSEVVVCEGFMGNVILKVCEGYGEQLLDAVFSQVKGHYTEEGPCLAVIKSVAERYDYTRYGGGVLLGVDGITIISHGRSNARAIESAVELGRSFFNSEGNCHIVELLEPSSEDK